MSARDLNEALDAVARPLRGLSGLARLLPAVAGGIGCAAAAAWLVRGGVLGGPVTVLSLWALVTLLLVAGLVAARHAIRSLGPWHVAEELEARGAWRRGALTTVLDGAAPGTSETLHRAAGAERADEVRGRAAEALAPAMAMQARRARLAAGMLLVGGVALAMAQPLRGAPVRLWQPITAWRALTAPVRLTARDSSVVRGVGATLSLEAVGQTRAVLSTRSPGEAWHREEVALDAEGRATITTPPLAADLTARLEAGDAHPVMWSCGFASPPSSVH